MARLLTILLLLFIQAHAIDLGTIGNCYEITEEDFGAYLKKKMERLSITELNQKLQQNYVVSIQNIKPVNGLKKATQYSVRYIDPTISPNQDIFDHEGHLIVKKGVAFNPLDQVSLTEDLAFFDATDKEQLSWVKGQQRPTKWILIRGNPLELENEEGRAVYFDQGGILVKHFAIQNIPALISQEGKKLKIEEFNL